MPSAAEDFSSLFARAREGDEDAWSELFQQCYPMVVRVVRRRLNQPMRSLYDSTDFASDVWESLLTKSGRFDFPSMQALMGFLAQSAERKVIDEYRRSHSGKRDRTRETRIEAADPEENGGGLSLASNDPTPSQVAVANERFELASEGLDDEHRTLLNMAREGYSTQEIAEALNWHIRKVQRRLQILGRKFRLYGESWPGSVDLPE